MDYRCGRRSCRRRSRRDRNHRRRSPRRRVRDRGARPRQRPARHARPQDRQRGADRDARRLRHVRAVQASRRSRSSARRRTRRTTRSTTRPNGRRRLADAGWMVVTGAGPGIMEAGMEGAGRERSIGVSIRSAVRDRCQLDHRRRRQARVDEVLLHAQADAGQGERRLRLPAGRLRHARRDLRAAHAHPDGQGHPGADRVPRHARRPVLGGRRPVRPRPARRPRAVSPRPTRRCTRSPTRATTAADEIDASTPTTTRSGSSATTS